MLGRPFVCIYNSVEDFLLADGLDSTMTILSLLLVAKDFFPAYLRMNGYVCVCLCVLCDVSDGDFAGLAGLCLGMKKEEFWLLCLGDFERVGGELGERSEVFVPCFFSGLGLGKITKSLREGFTPIVYRCFLCRIRSGERKEKLKGGFNSYRCFIYTLGSRERRKSLKEVSTPTIDTSFTGFVLREEGKV